MIPKSEIANLSVEWGLRATVVEKDYVIGWLLGGISSNKILRDSWVFKGGTCLKKCYFETYRFSEDLDFTVLPSGGISSDDIVPLIKDVLENVYDKSGIDFSGKDVFYKLRPSSTSAEGRIYYRGPLQSRSYAKVKIDLDSKEKVARPPVIQRIRHPFSDELPGRTGVRSYSFEELFAEKIRALGERCRPRDLYDVVSIHRNSALRNAPRLVYKTLSRKCESKGVPVPTYNQILSSNFCPELESEWENMLGHQLHTLPPYPAYLTGMQEFFEWLEGRVEPRILAALPMGPNEDVDWTPPQILYTLGTQTPLEPIRFAGANRLLVKIHYMKPNGQDVYRDIEPYAFRRTKDGNIILHAYDKSSDGYRTFRVDRLLKATVSKRPFNPRNIIEFSQRGTIAIPPTTDGDTARTSSRSSGRSRASRAQGNQSRVYIIECYSCGRRFPHSVRNTALRKHKDKYGNNCYSRRGHVVDTRYR